MMKQLVKTTEWRETSDTGRFVLRWAESILETSLITNQDGSTSRISRPRIREFEEERRYSNSHERTAIEKEIAQLGGRETS
ncbi:MULTISPECIES: hypothetical protein [Bradyrhizobium]|uniref:hypothetical protein n=1 Tax=Bradyrhizobium TaxID=374 RepID=UPI00114CE9AA|nr:MULTISPECIES: hypothetical protein [Bradyrhizobium]MCA1544694.1 hypothetical protein [Bradyrhizobium sp. NBAIM32]